MLFVIHSKTIKIGFLGVIHMRIIEKLLFIIVTTTFFLSRSISYNDIINTQSFLWQQAQNKPLEEIFSLLIGSSGSGTTIVTDVPGISQTTTLQLTMNADESSVQVYLNDANNNNVIEGRLHMHDKRAYLSLLRCTPQKGSSVLGPKGYKRLISGKIAVEFWDRFWQLWGIKKGFLTDAAVYDDFYLRILLPYVYGHSWYGGFGYLPIAISKEQYIAAVAFLRQRLVSDILQECAQLPEAQKKLMNALAYSKLSNNCTIGDLVKQVYLQWRSNNPEMSMRAKEILTDIYGTFLNSYPVKNDAVTAAQYQVNSNNYLEKVI